MNATLEKLYPAVGSYLYFLTLIWAVFLAAEHAGNHPRHAMRVWRRIRPIAQAFVAAWVVMGFTLIFGVPRDLVAPGVNHALFNGLQLFTAWVALPAGLWLVAQAGSGAGWRPEGWILWPVVIGVGAIVISQFGMIPFDPKLSPEVEKMYESGGWREAGLILGVLLAAPVEEVIFRVVVQGRFELWARNFGWTDLVPVVATSFLWTLGHAGIVEPRGVKELQIFVLGLLFGWTRRRWGLAGCIIAHGLLNGYACISQIIQWIHP